MVIAMSESKRQETTTPIQDKWGEALHDGFVVIPSALLRHQHKLKIDNGEMVVLMNLLMSWWKVGTYPFPSTTSIAKRMGVSRRTAQRHIERLEDKGLIRRIWGPTQHNIEQAKSKYDLTGIVTELKRLGGITHPSRQKISG